MVQCLISKAEDNFKFTFYLWNSMFRVSVARVGTFVTREMSTRKSPHPSYFRSLTVFTYRRLVTLVFVQEQTKCTVLSWKCLSSECTVTTTANCVVLSLSGGQKQTLQLVSDTDYVQNSIQVEG
jgi:hypothetical protein